MKTYLLGTLVMLILFGASAQPQGINYQGVARDSIGRPVPNQNISLRLSILDGSAVGTAVYVGTQNSTTNGSGLFSVSIGMGSVITGVFTDVAWGNGNKWLKVEMDLGGGNGYVLIGTTQFLSVPYSLFAENGLPADTSVSIGDMLYWNGTFWKMITNGSPGQVLTLGDNNVPIWTTKVELGDYYQGGYVFYLIRPNEPGYDPFVPNGLIVAHSNQELAQWGCAGTTITGTSINIGTGEQNTAAILGGCSQSNIAARICDDLVLNGYSDWFLPSLDELYLLSSISGFIRVFELDLLWSSSEFNANMALSQELGSGGQYYFSNDNLALVRAIRSF